MNGRASSIASILAAALVAGAAGIAGALIVAAYVLPPTVPENGAGARSARPPAEGPDAEALSRAAAATVRVYVGAGTQTPAGTVFAPEQLKGGGVVLTADGWIAVDRSGWNAEAALVSAAGRRLAVERTVDAAAVGLIFAKVSGRDLSVVAFGDSRTLEAGTDLYAPENGGFARHAFISASHRDGQAAQAETLAEFRRRMLTDGPAAMPGTPFYTARGELAALADEDGRALPVEIVRIALGRVLSGEAIGSSDLGIRGLPLVAVTAPDPALAARTGWYVTEVRTAARSRGLQVGDVVRSVGSDAVTGAHPLQEILAEYPPESRPELLVLRDGQEIRIPLTLTAP